MNRVLLSFILCLALGFNVVYSAEQGVVGTRADVNATAPVGSTPYYTPVPGPMDTPITTPNDMAVPIGAPVDSPLSAAPSYTAPEFVPPLAATPNIVTPIDAPGTASPTSSPLYVSQPYTPLSNSPLISTPNLVEDGEDSNPQPTLFFTGGDASLSNDDSFVSQVNGSSNELELNYFVDIYLKWTIPNNVNSMTALSLSLQRVSSRDSIISLECAVYIEPVDDWDEETVSASNRQGLTFHKTEQDRLTMCTIDTEGLTVNLDQAIVLMARAIETRHLTLRISLMDNTKRHVSQATSVLFYSRESGVGVPTLAMAYCGDMIVQNGEECDAGPLGGLTCNPDCTFIRGSNNQTVFEVLANADPRIIAPVVVVVLAVSGGVITFLILFYNRKQRLDQIKYKPFRGPNALVINGNVRQERLVQLEHLLTDRSNNFALAVALCRVVNAAEMDHTAKALSFVFQHSHCCLELLEQLVSYEVQRTVQETTLFRQDSMASKIMGSYANIIGTSYLKSVLEPVLDPIVRHKIRCEVESLKLDADDNVDANRVNLEAMCGQVFAAIIDQPQRMPEQIQRLCQLLRTKVESRFPNSAYKSIGAFLFLRFISPAVLLSTTNGIVTHRDSTTTPRALMLVARVLTKLANEVQFMPHEKDFLFMNDFLTRNLPLLHRFYDTITVVMNRPIDVNIPSAAKDQGLITLFTGIERNFEKIKPVLQDSAVIDELSQILAKDEVQVFLEEDSSSSIINEASSNNMRERLV